MPKALIIGTPREDQDALRRASEAAGFAVETAHGAATARGLFAEGAAFDLVFLDVLLEDEPGIALLEEIDTDACEVVITADRPTVGSAVEALRAGALDYLERPIDERQLAHLLRGVTRSLRLRGEVLDLSGQLQRLGRFGALVGASEPMRRVYQVIRKVAPSDGTAFVMGETGTGKELVARSLHDRSPRAERPFVPVNCAAVSPTLFESELFGHVKGAFTGADKEREGLFEQADEGSLFLDEVTEMPLELQAKLLRVLETGEVSRVGGQRTRKVDVRVIAASNRRPEDALSEGKIRQDLLYRLMVLPIVLPPLRERGRDVKLLVRHFVEKAEEEQGREIAVSPKALQKLYAYSWPGNVRELANAIQRAALLASDEILPEHLSLDEGIMAGVAKQVVGDEDASPPVSQAGPDEGLLSLEVGKTTLADAEKELILATLEHCKGNKRAASRVLGMSVKTLYTRLHRYGVPMRKHKSRG